MSDVVIKISGDIKNFSEAMEKIQAQTESLQGALTKAAATSGAAFAVLAAEIGFSVKAYGESEAASRKLALAMQNQGLYSTRLVESYKEYARVTQAATGLDDDAIVAAQARLQQLIGQEAITQELTTAMADMAETTGSLESASEILGRAIQGNTRGLKQFGIEIDDGLTKQERMQQILDKVRQKIGGSAEDAAKAAGNFRSLHTALGNLQEEIGARFAPIVDRAKRGLTEFVQLISGDSTVMDWTAALIGAGAAASGLVLVLSTLTLGLIAANAAAAAFGTTLSGFLLGPVGLVAAGVIALGGAVGYYIAQASQSAQTTEAAANRVKTLSSKVEEQKRTVEELTEAYKRMKGHDPFVESAAKKKVEAANQQLLSLNTQLARAKRELAEIEAKAPKQDQGKKNLAKDEALAEDEKNRLIKESRERHNLAMELQARGASEKRIALVQQESDILKQMAEARDTDEYNALVSKFNRAAELEAEQIAQEREQRDAMSEENLLKSAEYEEMTEAQRAGFRERNLMALQQEVLTERAAREQIAKTEIQIDTQKKNQLLLDQTKYGKALGTMKNALLSEEVANTATAFDNLSSLMRTHSRALFNIGKAAGIASAVINTAVGITRALSELGPIMGPIMATTIGVMGGVQIATIAAQTFAYAKGGLVSGGIPNADSVPAMLTPGELVIPKANFEEVIGSVRAAREAVQVQDQIGGPGGQGGGIATIVLELKDDLMEFIEAKLVERENIGISLQRV